MTENDRKTKITFDDSLMRSVSADAFEVTLTREEIALLFGKSLTQSPRRDEISAMLKRHIVMSPFTFKRLALALNHIINSFSPVKVTHVKSDKKMPASSRTEKKPEKGRFLFQLIEDLHVGYGFEKSFKMAPKKLLGNRFLLAVNKKDTQQERILAICEQMDMPENFFETFKENLSDTNTVGFGFEKNERGCVYKIYLEFWDKIKKEVYYKVDKTEPVLLHLGFKWDALDNTKRAVARYTAFPLLSIKNILKRISTIYDALEERTPFEIAKGVIELASSRAVNEMFIYLEASEENNPRRSFDINLYKANLPLSALYPYLKKMCHHYSIPPEEFNLLYDQINTKTFGHLSAGIGKEGEDFLTTSYEIEAL